MKKRKALLISLFIGSVLIGCSSNTKSNSTDISSSPTGKTIEQTISDTVNDLFAEELPDKADNQDIKQSPDKYTYYVKDYINMNLASVGYYSLGGELLDEYGAGQLKINCVNPRGIYINLENKDDLKKYVVVAQSIKPNAEIKYTFMKDSEGKEYDNLVSFQTVEEIDLSVIEVGSNDTAVPLIEIKPSKDKYKVYIRNYVGRNLATVGYYSLGGEILDKYGEGTLKINFITEDGSYIDQENRELHRAYVVTGQNIKPNKKLTFTFLKDSDGKEYDNLVDTQSYDSINLNVKKVENADEILNAIKNEDKIDKNKSDKNKKERESDSKDESEKLVDGMRTEFKQAMDTYEEFYNEYCKALKKYKKNPTDITILANYTKLIEKQVEIDENFREWDGNLNDKELTYYLEVSSRILKKLADIK